MRFIDEHMVGLGSIGIIVVLIAAYLLMGTQQAVYYHCSATPPPLAGHTCLDYMPTLDE